MDKEESKQRDRKSAGWSRKISRTVSDTIKAELLPNLSKNKKTQIVHLRPGLEGDDRWEVRILIVRLCSNHLDARTRRQQKVHRRAQCAYMAMSKFEGMVTWFTFVGHDRDPD